MTSDRVLITGVTGVVGRALAKRLVREGVPVTGAVRAMPDSARRLAGVDYAVVGDIGPDTGWDAALDSARYVVHAAGVTGDQPSSLLQRVNVQGTASLASAAAGRVAAMLLVSSLGVHGCASESRAIRATDTPAPYDAYSQSKLHSERAMLERLEGSQTAWVIVRPPMIYGSGSAGTPNRLQAAVRRGWPLPLGAIRNRRSLIGAENLADFLCSAVRDERALRKAWLVADPEDLSTPDLLRVVAQAEGVSVSLPSVPVELLRLLGRLAGRARDAVRLTESLYVDRTATRELLGWVPPRSTLDEWRDTMTATRGR